LVRLLGGLPAQDDEGDHGLAGGVVLRAHHGRFGDPLVGDQGRFDLGGGQVVPGDVHDIVQPAQQPDVAVLVVLGAVAGEVGAGETGPVGLLEPLLIAPDAAQHARPGLVDHQVAAATGAHRLPESSQISTSMPGRARWAAPGLASVTPGSGEIMIPPVSVCHQVSTTGVRSPPITRRYHVQASGLIGSPTLPSTRSEDRSYSAGISSPHFMKVRIAVGAAYSVVTLCFCTISQNRPLCGVSGVPSYITWV